MDRGDAMPHPTTPAGDPHRQPTDTKDDMAKHAVRVAVRNVVRVVKAPPALAATARATDRQAPRSGRPACASQPELLSGVSWDDGRKVWLVHPAPTPVRG